MGKGFQKQKLQRKQLKRISKEILIYIIWHYKNEVIKKVLCFQLYHELNYRHYLCRFI